MSIVKMKRLRVIGFAEERNDLLQQLLHLGCVEISEPEDKVTDPEWTALLRRDTSALSQRKAEASALTSALQALFGREQAERQPGQPVALGGPGSASGAARHRPHPADAGHHPRGLGC